MQNYTNPAMQMTSSSRDIRELKILGREHQPRLHKTKTAITEIKALKLCRDHNLKDLLSE